MRDFGARGLVVAGLVLLACSSGEGRGGGRQEGAARAVTGIVPFTILHTNDFHGQLEASGSNPGIARVAQVVNDVRTTVGAANVLLADAGDEMQGSLLSNLQKGEPTIAAFNAMAYDVATFGNHDFDWGQAVLQSRVTQSSFPHLSANIVTGTTCSDPANWTSPAFATPYVVKTVAGVRVGFIGVTTTETPTITVASATAGLCFRDPVEAILHYYDELATQADVLVVLSHLGYADGGYGYGLPVEGDQTLARRLIQAGKPVHLVIGGHSHTSMDAATVVTVSGMPGKTTVAQAHYNGRRVGRADLTYDGATGAVTVTWQRLLVSTSGAENAGVRELVATYAAEPAYQALVDEPVGYVRTDLALNSNGDSMMGAFIDDALYQALNTDADPSNDVDVFFNNPGGLRTNWCAQGNEISGYAWSSTSTDCHPGELWTHPPMLLTYGHMFQILPFGNATVVGTMTGAQLLEVLNQGAAVSRAIQPAGLRYKFYAYKDALPGPQPWAFGAWDACVVNKATATCEPLDLSATYKVGTNEFLAPAGGDGFVAFKYMQNLTYLGDMLNLVNAWVTANYTLASPYRGPRGDGTLDGRIARDGSDSGGTVVPLTVLHHNDSHGNLVQGTAAGYTQLATLIKQERSHNPTRTLLLHGGDAIQGDAMMYYFKTAPSGFASDGTPLLPALQTHPAMAAMNAMGYDAMTLGNHEFNFGDSVFRGILHQAAFPVLGVNVADTGAYGLASVTGDAGVKPYMEKTVGEGIRVAVLGITNHRVPSYELPSNIPGLTFSDPIAAAQTQISALRATHDVVIALTHLGFTTNPSSVEVDSNVDTTLAAQVSGIDAIVGAHSHTNPGKADAPYKYLPALVPSPAKVPVLVHQAYRYNTTLGETILGLLPLTGGGFEVVTRAGQYLTVSTSSTPTPEDPELVALLAPYVTALASYQGVVVGQTTVPIDTRVAFTQETNGANLQADAAVTELALHGITTDLHLSGAMTNKVVASTATAESPVTLTVADMFAAMPYENSLVVLRMNGPQLKAVLERGYRNYYYYKYVSGYGGYSYYTTCMLDVDGRGKVMFRDEQPSLPDGDNVAALLIGGQPVDFADAGTYYSISTVNYLAAGSCNFNDAGVSLWPLGQMEHDTQYYVRDAVIDHITAQGTVSPAIEGRLLFGDADLPVITVSAPTDGDSYPRTAPVAFGFTATDATSGVKAVTAEIDGTPVASGQLIDAQALRGHHTLTVTARDYYDNVATQAVSFDVANAAPVASDVAVTSQGGEAVAVALSATDADGDPLTYRVLDEPAHGTLSGSGASLEYAPAQGWTGTETFTYVASDGVVDSAAATVTIVVKEEEGGGGGTGGGGGGHTGGGGCASGGSEMAPLALLLASLALLRLPWARRRGRSV